MLSRFKSSQDGNVAILATMMISGVAVVMAFCIEAANLYVTKLQNQRAADLGNLAAASTGTPVVGGVASNEAIATAANVVVLNGLSDAAVLTRSGPSPTDAQQQALFTTVTRDKPLTFGGLMGSSAPNPVRASSAASLNTSRDGACLASLVGPTNIYGEARVTGPACGVSAMTYLHVCGNADVSLAKASVGYTALTEAPLICKSALLAPPPRPSPTEPRAPIRSPPARPW